MGRLWTALIPLAAFAAAPPAPLAIETLAVAQYEDGPHSGSGVYFVPGEALFLSFHAAGYRTEGDEEKSLRLSWTIQAFDPAGIPISKPVSEKLATGLAHEDKAWRPKIRHTIEVPPFAPPGTYKIAIKLKDEIANTEVSKEAAFTVKARAVEPAAALTIRPLAFYRGDEDKHPLADAAYRPGDAVWIRFDIVGFKLAEGNHYDVRYGIAVLRPNGERLFEQADAAAERDQSFYPRTYVPAGFSLNLTRDLAPGVYTVVVKAADQVGSQTAETRGPFTVVP